MTKDEIFDTIESKLKEKYNQWKLLRHKRLEVKGYKRAYLDVKKIREKMEFIDNGTTE